MTKEYSMVVVDGFGEYFMVHYITDVNISPSPNQSGYHDVYCPNVPHSRRLYESKHSKRIADLKQIIKSGDVESTNPLVYSGYCKRTRETLRIEIYLSESYKWKLLKAKGQKRLQKAIEEADSFWRKLKVQLFGINISVPEQKLYLNGILDELIKHRQRTW